MCSSCYLSFLCQAEETPYGYRAYKYPRGGTVTPMLSLIDLSREPVGDRATVAFEQQLLAHWEGVVWVTLQGEEISQATARIRLQQHFGWKRDRQRLGPAPLSDRRRRWLTSGETGGSGEVQEGAQEEGESCGSRNTAEAACVITAAT